MYTKLMYAMYSYQSPQCTIVIVLIVRTHCTGIDCTPIILYEDIVREDHLLNVDDMVDDKVHVYVYYLLLLSTYMFTTVILILN